MRFKRFRKRFKRSRFNGGNNFKRSIVNVARSNKRRYMYGSIAIASIFFVLYKVGILTDFKQKIS